MLIEMHSPAFKIKGEERPPIIFDKGLNVVLGKNDGAMSIGKSSTLLAIDFVFGGDTYIKSDGVRQEGDHTIYFTFKFNGKEHRFARNTGSADKIYLLDEKFGLTGNVYTKAEFTDWLKVQYGIDFVGLSFRTTLSSFFRIYGKELPTAQTAAWYTGSGYGKVNQYLCRCLINIRYRRIQEQCNRTQ